MGIFINDKVFTVAKVLKYLENIAMSVKFEIQEAKSINHKIWT